MSYLRDTFWAVIYVSPKIEISAMIRTLLTENGLEWREFKYEFEPVDDAQSTLEEFT